jgi:hypothetical protein
VGPTVAGVHDTEQQDLRALLTILDQIDPWLGLVASDEPSGAWTVQPRSPLSTDDARTHPYRVSHRAWMALTPAVDFLACLRGSIVGARQGDQLNVRLHAYAQAGLIRGALENACCAVWLLGPGRTERVTNRLALEWKELKPAYRLRDLAGSPPPRTIEQRQQQLVDLLLTASAAAAPAGQVPAVADDAAARRTLRGLSYTTIVRRAGELSNAGADETEAAWSMCSGLAHGDASATLGVLDTTVVQEVTPGISLTRVSPQVKLLVIATGIAYAMTALAFRQLQERCRAPY